MTRDFRLLVAGQALSWLGNGFQQVALATAVVLEGGGPSELGLVMASGVLALLAGSLFGGVWADRLQPRAVMAASDLVRIGTVSGMAVMFGTDHQSTPVLCALAALSSLAGSLFGPAMTSLKPLVLPVESRQQGNARISLVQTTCSVLGPAAGGLVVATFGATTGFVVNAASYGASVASVLLLRTRADRVRAQTGVLHDMRRGWAAIRERDWLLAGVLAATAYHVANGMVIVLARWSRSVSWAGRTPPAWSRRQKGSAASSAQRSPFAPGPCDCFAPGGSRSR